MRGCEVYADTDTVIVSHLQKEMRCVIMSPLLCVGGSEISTYYIISQRSQ